MISVNIQNCLSELTIIWCRSPSFFSACMFRKKSVFCCQSQCWKDKSKRLICNTNHEERHSHLSAQLWWGRFPARWNQIRESLSPKSHFQRHLLIKWQLNCPHQSQHERRILISGVRKGALTEIQTSRALCLEVETERAKARGLRSRDAQAFLTWTARAQCIIECRGKGFGDPCPTPFRSHLPQWNQVSGFVVKTSQTQSLLELSRLLRGPMT